MNLMKQILIRIMLKSSVVKPRAVTGRGRLLERENEKILHYKVLVMVRLILKGGVLDQMQMQVLILRVTEVILNLFLQSY